MSRPRDSLLAATLMAIPEVRTSLMDAICSIGAPRPHMMTGFFVDWFQKHFATTPNIEEPQLRGLLWTAVDSSNLEIESITRWKPQTTGKRPAIIVSRNDWKVLSLGIDNRMMVTRGISGIEHYAAYLQGSHTMFCLSGKPVEAEILSAEVYREMMQFGPLIRKELELMRFAAMGVGKLFEVEESAGHFAVPVTVAYFLEEKWRLIPQTPKLKNMKLSAWLP